MWWKGAGFYTGMVLWARPSRLGVQMVCQVWYGLNQFIPARMDGFIWECQGCVTLLPNRHHPSIGRHRGFTVRAGKGVSVTNSEGEVCPLGVPG